MNLTHDAMLVSLRINSWSGRLYDRQASQQVAVHTDADTSAGRYNKRLLPKQAFAALAATMSNARTSHNANTLPWNDQGGRLLTVANYDRYTAALDTLSSAWCASAPASSRTTTITSIQAPPRPRPSVPPGGLSRHRGASGQVRHSLPHRPGPHARHFMADLAQARPSGSGGISSNRSAPASTMRSAISTGASARRSSGSANACARTERQAARIPDSLIENIRELVAPAPA